MQLTHKTKIETKIVEDGGSVAIRLQKPIAEWLDVKTGDAIVIVCEKGKWGNYIGVGKNGKH